MPRVEPLAIPRLTARVDRQWKVPGSKSITNRALLLAALAEGTSVLENVLTSDDTEHMRNGLGQLGIGISDGAPGQVIVQGGRSRLRPSPTPLYVGNSGTTVRFLTALASLVPGTTTLVGDAAMALRPLADLVDGLRQLGVAIDCATGAPPVTVHGGRLPGGRIAMRGDRSSQYFSALLLVAGYAEADLHIDVVGTLVSRPYVEMTARMVRDFGGHIDSSATGFLIHRTAAYRARSYWVEPDASSASYPFALAAAGGHRLVVPRLDASSLQGDYHLVDMLERMGAVVEREATFTAVSGPGAGRLRGLEADFADISDTVMTVAAIAPLCTTPVVLTGIGNIRIKETDRLLATVTELTRLGCTVSSGADWLRIEPGPPRAATVHCYHRMAMSFAVLGAIQGGVTIEDPRCTAKTYPGFWDDLGSLYPAAPW